MRYYPNLLAPHHLKKWFPDISDFEAVIKKSEVGCEIVDREKIKRGFSECFFSSFLTHYFHGKIYVDIGIRVAKNDYRAILKPDFVLYDPNFNFHCAIEIDEPYAMESGEPLHYIGEYDDKTGLSDFDAIVPHVNEKEALKDTWAWVTNQYHRSVLIVEQGWYLIRFSERQVVEYPNECCKFIFDSYPDYIKVVNDERIFSHVSEVPKGKRWNEIEAREMSSKKYRTEYLSTILSSKDNLGVKTYDAYKTVSSKWKKYDVPPFSDDLPF